ncbi:hypothetical protein [Rhodosalinus sp. 5P4]|uniref:hypothetical protein n=1 Tax=Rhodosalinus sp. 5P4 TaxID=3239196 RepID=UPI0035241732
MTGPEGASSLLAFACDLPPEARSARVIAAARDATLALHDGTPGTDDAVRLAARVPRQEAGRVSAKEVPPGRGTGRSGSSSTLARARGGPG